jgi:hypothetical protein
VTTARLGVALLAVVGALACVGAALADTIKIGVYSQKESSGQASIGASVVAASTGKSSAGVDDVVNVAPPQQPLHSYPTLPAASPLLANPTPLGAGTFWYSDGPGRACIYRTGSSPLCYVVTSNGGGLVAPVISPAAIAAAAVERLGLAPGRIEASPRQGGLSGTESWFWLSPQPDTRELTVALAGERVTVTAEPAVEWRFGDDSSLTGGGGVPYRAGPPPESAIRHAYETRCLAGDRGRNPYVLPSCRDDGYRVEAIVHWRISYRASGRVGESGTLPPRATETAVAYPVTEARAFLIAGGER